MNHVSSSSAVWHFSGPSLAYLISANSKSIASSCLRLLLLPASHSDHTKAKTQVKFSALTSSTIHVKTSLSASLRPRSNTSNNFAVLRVGYVIQLSCLLRKLLNNLRVLDGLPSWSKAGAK
jgi:hypothetical protein